MWLYSVSEWCSPNHAYFQFERSAAMTYSASRCSIVCSLAVSWPQARQVAVDVDPELHRVLFPPRTRRNPTPCPR